jgi:23S rRNA (uracil-5-)-methyltransferase RumA
MQPALKATAEWVRTLQCQIDSIDLCHSGDGNGVTIQANAERVPNPEDKKRTRDYFEDNPVIRSLVLSAKGSRWVWGQEMFHDTGGRGFVQANRLGNEVLLREVLRLGAFTATDRVLELYCGSGNFTFSIAEHAQKVVGLDVDRNAIGSAKSLARKLGVTNTRFLCGPAEAAQHLLSKAPQRFTKLLLDPPREGARRVLQNIKAPGPSEILYVSCNPSTLARDLALLSSKGYRLKEIQPLDLFPQTYHVEAIAWLMLA